MTSRAVRQESRCWPLIVGVVTSLRELESALRLPTPPDFFEIRLDHLCRHLDKVENALPHLSKRAALIMTARDPREGGANRLSIRQRTDLLFRFLPHARLIDVELRSASIFKTVLTRVRSKKIGCILSFHDFNSTPAVGSLKAKGLLAKKCGAHIFKVATRTDSKSDLARLLEFFMTQRHAVPICAMGIGRFGAESRRQLLRRGSVLNYASLGTRRIAGQPSLAQMRRWALAAPEFGNSRTVGR